MTRNTSGWIGKMPTKRVGSKSSNGTSNRRSNCSRDMYRSSSGCRKDNNLPSDNPELTEAPPGQHRKTADLFLLRVRRRALAPSALSL